MSFFPAVAINLSFQTGYFFVMNRFMLKKDVKLFYFPRILLAYLLFHAVHEEIYIKRYLLNTIRININDMFDQDEPFLFSSNEFKRLIKRMHDNYAHLINPNFDLSSIVKDHSLSIPSKKTAEPVVS